MKKIFRMALVFALAGATLVYTGCTKDYAEEIGDLNKELAKTQDELKSVKDALAAAEALAKAAATKSELSAEVGTLNTAINNLRTALEGDIADLGGDITNLENEIADLWEAIDNLETALDEKIQALDEKIEGEDGLRKAIDEAKAAIAAIFNQIQSVVFVPEFADQALAFYSFEKAKGDSTLAVATFKVTPEAKATEIGTKYAAALNVVSLKETKKAEAPVVCPVSIVSADAATGYVEIAALLGKEIKSDVFAAALQLTEVESKTNISSSYIPAKSAAGTLDKNCLFLFDKDGEKVSTFKNLYIRYDDNKAKTFFEDLTPKFEFPFGIYTREEFAKIVSVAGIELSWKDSILVSDLDKKDSVAFVLSGVEIPSTVAVAKSDTAYSFVGCEAKANWKVSFTFGGVSLIPSVATFGPQSVEIVKTYSADIIKTDKIDLYWNYKTWNKIEFADNTLPVVTEGGVSAIANDDDSDFIKLDTLGYLSKADFEKYAAKGVDSLIEKAGKKKTENWPVVIEFSNDETVSAAINVANPTWSLKDTSFVAIFKSEKKNTNYAVAVPVNVYAKPADIVVEKYDIAVKKGATTYKFEKAFDKIYTPAFENLLVNGLAGKTSKKDDAKQAFKEAISRFTNVTEKFYDNGDVTKTPHTTYLSNLNWSVDNADLIYTLNPGFTKYADSDSVTVDFSAFGVKITIKTLAKAEKAPAYALGFINNPRLTISATDPKSASAYAALSASTGKPETAYMNQFVQVVRPAGTTTTTYNTDALKVDFVIFAQNKQDSTALSGATLDSADKFAHKKYSPQSDWNILPGADTLKAYIDDYDPAIPVNWHDTTHVRTIPVKAVLYCDGIALDSVLVNVWTDDPFAGEGAAFAGYNFKFDASEREDRDIEMTSGTGLFAQTFYAYDSLTVKSPLYANNLVSKYFYKVIPGNVPTVGADGKVVEHTSAQLFYTPDANKLGVKIWVAPAKEWTLNNGEKVIDNPTNFGVDAEHARVTLKRGVKLTEDVTVTIPIKLYYTLGGPISSQVTVTFTK